MSNIGTTLRISNGSHRTLITNNADGSFTIALGSVNYSHKNIDMRDTVLYCNDAKVNDVCLGSTCIFDKYFIEYREDIYLYERYEGDPDADTGDATFITANDETYRLIYTLKGNSRDCVMHKPNSISIMNMKDTPIELSIDGQVNLSTIVGIGNAYEEEKSRMVISSFQQSNEERFSMYAVIAYRKILDKSDHVDFVCFTQPKYKIVTRYTYRIVKIVDMITDNTLSNGTPDNMTIVYRMLLTQYNVLPVKPRIITDMVSTIGQLYVYVESDEDLAYGYKMYYSEYTSPIFYQKCKFSFEE